MAIFGTPAIASLVRHAGLSAFLAGSAAVAYKLTIAKDAKGAPYNYYAAKNGTGVDPHAYINRK